MNCSICHEEIKDEQLRTNTEMGYVHGGCYEKIGATMIGAALFGGTDHRILRRIQALEQFMDDVKRNSR